MPLSKKGEGPRAAEASAFGGEQPNGLLQPETPAVLLGTPRRKLLIQHIWQRTSLSRGQFQRLYQEPIERYASLVQKFPASESHHHAYPGGMLDHGLEIVAFGLKLRQSHLLPAGSAPEVQAAQAEAWTAGTAYAALLHDVGKIAVDLEVECHDGKRWHPWHGALTQAYRFRFRSGRIHRLHEAAAGLLYANILGPNILDWLSGYPELWAALLYVLASRHEHAGVLGELVAQADRASVAQSLGGDASKAQPDVLNSLQRKLREGLRYLIRERFRLNQPQASDGWLTKDALWLVSKTACDKLRAHLLSNGISGVPESNSVLFDVLQEHGLIIGNSGGRAIWSARVTGTNGWTQEFTFLQVAPSWVWDSDDRPPSFQGQVTAVVPDKKVDDETIIETRQSPERTAADAKPAHLPAGDATQSQIYFSSLPPLPNPGSSPLPCDDRQSDVDYPDSPRIDAETVPASPVEPQVANVDGANTSNTTSPNSIGERFLYWLKLSVGTRKLIVNDARALVHTVDGTAFVVTPRIFQRFLQEFPVIHLESRDDKRPPWMGLQRSFERLARHRKHSNGLNIWTCHVRGPRKTRTVNGYLLLDGRDVFADIPPDNPYLQLSEAAADTSE